ILCIFFFQAEDGIRDFHVTGVQTCALPISSGGEERRASAPAEPSSQRVGRDQLLLEARGVGLERKDGRVVLRDVDLEVAPGEILDRKSTRLNSSHVKSSYAVICLEKKRREW